MPNMIIIVIAACLAYALINHSANKDGEQTRQELAHMPNPPEHALVSGEPSPGAWIVAIIVIIAGAYLAMPK